MYKCNYCGKEFKSKIPHRCKGGFRKHKLSFSIVPDSIEYSSENPVSCEYNKSISVGSKECKSCSFNLGTKDTKVLCANHIDLDLGISSPDHINRFSGRDLYKLVQLRDFYNNIWKPDWTTDNVKYCIKNISGQIVPGITTLESRLLTFKDEITRDLFLNHYKNLIESLKEFI